LPNFKGRACNLDFPALHESNFAAYFIQGASFLGPKSQLKSNFEAEKSILDPKVDLKYRFFDLKWLDSHSFEGFKFKEATQNKSRKTIFDNPKNCTFAAPNLHRKSTFAGVFST